MFGYFRPYESKLTNQQSKIFTSYYCRQCYCLRIKYGQVARFFTLFDAAVYSIIAKLSCGEARPPQLKCERIGKKNLKYFENDISGKRMSDLVLIGFGEKIRDDEIDGGSTKWKLVGKLFKKPISSAQNNEPLIWKNSVAGTDKINELQDKNASIMEIFETYGNMVATSFNEIFNLKEDYKNLIKHLAMWTFFVDMAVDYDEDYKNKTYNGLVNDTDKSFEEYFSHHYQEFKDIEEKITTPVIDYLYKIKDDSIEWHILFKIIMHSLDTVIPELIEGKDVAFHYLKELRKNHQRVLQVNKIRKRLEKEQDEKD